jgi:hypothetical protein
MIQLEWLPTGWRQTLFLTSMLTFGLGITLVLNWNLGFIIAVTTIGILTHSLMTHRQHQLLLTECQLLRSELVYVQEQRVNSNGILEEWTEKAIAKDKQGRVTCQYCNSKMPLLESYPFDPHLHLKTKGMPCLVPIARSYFCRIDMVPPHIWEHHMEKKKV